MHRFALACLLALAWAPSAPAQDDGTATDEPDDGVAEIVAARNKPILRVLAGGQWWGGDYQVNRAYAGFARIDQLDRTTRLQTYVRADWDKYNFDVDLELAPDGSEPWDLIYSGALSLGVDTQWNNELGTVFGAIVQASWQDGAKVEDSIRAGGFAQVRYQFTPDLTLGGGVTVLTRLEKHPMALPRIVIDWKITNDISLTSLGAGIPNLQGTELAWRMGDGWELAAGAGFFYKEFRLDNDGNSLGQEGVGREDGMPIWLRVTKNLQSGGLTAFIGMGTDLDVRFDDMNGDWIGDADAGAAFIFGLQGSLRF